MKLLKQPFTLANINLHNRLVMPPMETRKATSEELVTNEIINYYNQRTQGAAIALVITEHAFVDSNGIAVKGQLGIATNQYIEGWERIAETIHLNGSKAIAQISHAGSATPSNLTKQHVALAPSAIINPAAVARKKEMPKEMTIEDITILKQKFVDAAMRMKQAGFDGVELHAAHGYLLSQFYSPLTNQRTDKYGAQSVASRLQIHIEIAQAIKQTVGTSFPVGIRLGACDYNMQGGSTLEELPQATRILAQYFDFIDVSGGLNGVSAGYTKEPGYFADASLIVKNNCSLPVIVTGGIRTTQQAEDILQRGAADLIGVGRPIFANANWAREAMATI